MGNCKVVLAAAKERHCFVKDKMVLMRAWFNVLNMHDYIDSLN
jgi:hypothetical protein